MVRMLTSDYIIVAQNLKTKHSFACMHKDYGLECIH